MKLLLLATLVAGANCFGWSRCNDKKNQFRDQHTCAIVFEDDGCKGDQEVLSEGYTKFSSAVRNDVESLMVRPGCVLIGYSNDRGARGDQYFEGHNAVFDASDRRSRDDPHVVENLDDDELDNDMESADCFCSDTRGVGRVQHLSSSKIEGKGFFDNLFGRNNAEECNNQIAVFNRPGNAQVKAMLFDEAGCKGYMKEVGTGYTSLTKLVGKDMENDAESVMVRPGCKLVATDHTKNYVFGRGDSFTIDASRNSGEPKARNLDGKRELENDISAVDVEC